MSTISTYLMRDIQCKMKIAYVFRRKSQNQLIINEELEIPIFLIFKITNQTKLVRERYEHDNLESVEIRHFDNGSILYARKIVERYDSP